MNVRGRSPPRLTRPSYMSWRTSFGFRARASAADSPNAAPAPSWVETRSCVTPVSAVQGKSVTTLEGLPALYAAQRKLSKAPDLHPVQQAMIDEQAVQCGYCYNGMIVKASELLSKIPQPDEAQIRTAMNGHLCRCGTYPRIIKAIQRASRTMVAEAAK
jgi:aerobic-type carbon monoxide dehydrogenase small subunit (CoxS/CutS family)